MFKPTLFLTVGLPASGKTYFAERLARDEGIFHLNCDLLRLAFIEQPTFTPTEHQQVFKLADFIVNAHLQQGLSIIYGANHNRLQHRENWRQRGNEQGFAVRIIYLQAPIEVIKERIESREHDIPLEKQRLSPASLLFKMQQNLEVPESSERPIIIDGTAPYAQQHQQFLQQFHPE